MLSCRYAPARSITSDVAKHPRLICKILPYTAKTCLLTDCRASRSSASIVLLYSARTSRTWKGGATLMVVAVASHNAWTADRGSLAFYAQRLTGTHQRLMHNMRLERRHAAGYGAVHQKTQITCCAAMANCRGVLQQQAVRRRQAIKNLAPAPYVGQP